MLWLPLLPPPPQSSFLSTTSLPFSLIQYINSSFHCSTLYFRQLYSPCQLTRWDVIDRTIYSGGIFQLSHLHHYYLLLLLLRFRCEFRTISRENDIQLLSQRERMNFAFAISPSSKLNLKYLDRSFNLFFFPRRMYIVHGYTCVCRTYCCCCYYYYCYLPCNSVLYFCVSVSCMFNTHLYLASCLCAHTDSLTHSLTHLLVHSLTFSLVQSVRLSCRIFLHTPIRLSVSRFIWGISCMCVCLAF